MKKILLATTILAASAGFASAEVTLSGSARMGLINDFGAATDTAFTSRARVVFTLSGETDGGLSFGASFRADNARNGAGLSANDGDAGSVYISGAFGKLSMGDVDGAGAATLGHVSYVGLTSLSSLNEVKYISNGGTNFDGTSSAPVVFGASVDPSVLYSYSTGDITVNVSATNPSGTADAYGVGVKYAMGAYTVGIAYEQADFANGTDLKQISIGGTATFGAATAKAIISQFDDGTTTANQYALSVDYKVNAATITAFYTDSSDLAATVLGGQKAYGLGASYDLGGGASVVGGYVRNDTAGTDAFDLGVSMSF